MEGIPMKTSSALLLLTACLALAGGTAYADEVTITYRSGTTQTIRLDEPSSTIVGISYQEDTASKVGPLSSRPLKAGTAGTAGGTATPAEKNTGIRRQKDKPEVRIEWAPPVE